MHTKLKEFLEIISDDHVVFYNQKIVSMDYLDKKIQFQFGCFRIRDNSNFGFIKTPKGEFFEVSRAFKSAKLVSKTQIEKLLGESKNG